MSTSVSSSSSGESVSNLPLPYADLNFPRPRRLKRREAEFIDSHIRSQPEDCVVAVLGTQTIRTRDLKRLRSIEWLGDPIINGYLGLVVTRLREQGLNVQAMNSDFSVMFRRGRTYSRELNPFDFDRVVIPLHVTDHWFAACLDMVNRTVVIGNSLPQPYEEELSHLFAWLKDMEVRYNTTERERPAWRYVTKRVPRQTNGYDCGVFTLLFCIASLLDIDCADLWQQNDIQDYREIIALDIMRMGAVSTSIVDVAPSLEYALLVELELLPNQSVRQLAHSIRVSKRYELVSMESAVSNVRTVLTEMMKRGEVNRREPHEGAQRGYLYYVPGYSAEVERCAASKAHVRQKYPPPMDRKLYSIDDAVISLLHRYGPLSVDQIFNYINLETYCKCEVKRRSLLSVLSRLRKHERIRKGRDQRYRKTLSAKPRSWLDDSLQHLRFDYKEFNDKRMLCIKKKQLGEFVRGGHSRVHGKGVFAKRFIYCDTLLELTGLFEPCKDASYRFVIGEQEFNASPKDSSHITSYINDLGPELSQAELVVVDGKPYIRMLKAVAAGTEIFCAYNARLSRSHWSEDYPTDWTSPFDYTSVDGKLKRRAEQDNPAKRQRIPCISLDSTEEPIGSQEVMLIN